MREIYPADSSTTPLFAHALIPVQKNNIIISFFQVRSDRLKKTDPKFVQRNAAFLLDTLLSLVSWSSSHVSLAPVIILPTSCVMMPEEEEGKKVAPPAL